MTRFMIQVLRELEAMRAVGMDVPEAALAKARDVELMWNYVNMGISECADLLCELARAE